MIRIKKIGCYTDECILWEGKVLIKDDNSFEGIIDSSTINVYVKGNIETNDSIEFYTIIPEAYPFQSTRYTATKQNNSDIYLGLYNNDDDIMPCSISLNEQELNQELVEIQIKELEFIIAHHKKTMNERYNEDLQILREYQDEKAAKKLEKKLRKHGKINYYL